MRLLALDSAGAGCSVAIWDRRADAILAYRRAQVERGHATLLMPMVKEVLTEAGVVLTALDGLAVTVGPGGFTGVRIGLAAARGLALAGALPVAGVTTLETVAADCPPAPEPILAVIDSRRAEPYCQPFAGGGACPPTPLAPPFAVTPERIARALRPLAPAWRLAGAGPLVAGALEQAGLCAPGGIEDRGPDARTVACVAAACWSARGRLGPGRPEPLYVRAPDVSPPRGGRTIS